MYASVELSQSSAPNSGRCLAAASMHPASSSGTDFVGCDAGAATKKSQERWRGRLDRIPDQATLRGRRFGAGAEPKSRVPERSENSRARKEALLVATACCQPPKGRAGWTLKLLAGAIVKLTDHNSLSHETDFGDRWRKMTSNPGAKTCGAFRRSMANTSPAWRTS